MTQPNPDTPPAAPAAPAAPPPVDPPKSEGVSQEELNRIATREKEQGRNAALAQVQQDLGVTLDEAKEIIRAAKEKAESQKTEAEKAREAADKEKSEAAKERAEAAQERHDARLERALLKSGITDDAKLARITRLVEAKVGDDQETINAAVETLKKDMPELFPTGATPPKRQAPNGDPAGSPPKPKQDEDAFSRGRARASAHRTAFTARVDKA